MSSARLLNFRDSIVYYGQLFTLYQQPESILYRKNIIKLDRQDNDIAYHIFCAQNLE